MKEEGSKGWWIVLLGFWADFLCMGGRSLILLVIVYWEDAFGYTRAELSTLMAVVHICNGISTPVSGHMIDKHPASNVVSVGLICLAVSFALTALVQTKWQVWLVYGVLSGISFGLVNLNVFTVAILRAVPVHQQGTKPKPNPKPKPKPNPKLYPNPKPNPKGIAIGFSSSGSTIGQLSLVPLFAVIAEGWGWRLGFACIAAAVALLVTPAFLLLREDERLQAAKQFHVLNQMDEDDDEEEERGGGEGGEERGKGGEEEGEGNMERDHSALTRLGILCSIPAYWVLLFVFVICGITTTGFLETHFIALVVDRGKSITLGASAFSLLSAANGIAMIVAGYLTDMVDRYLLLGCIFLLRMVAYALLLNFKSEGMLYLFAVLFGFADYSVVPPVCSLVKTISVRRGVDLTGLGIGVLLCWHSIGAAVGSWFGGLVFAQESHYQSAVIICGIMCIIAAVSLFAAPLIGASDGLKRGDGNGIEVASAYVDVVAVKRQVEITGTTSGERGAQHI